MVADSWGNTANGAPCRQAAWNGSNNQQWRLNSVGSGRYQIINRGTNTALDGMGNTAVGSTASMWSPEQQHQQPLDHQYHLKETLRSGVSQPQGRGQRPRGGSGHGVG